MSLLTENDVIVKFRLFFSFCILLPSYGLILVRIAKIKLHVNVVRPEVKLLFRTSGKKFFSRKRGHFEGYFLIRLI